MRRARAGAVLAAFGTGLALAAGAQQPPARQPTVPPAAGPSSAEPGAELRVFLLTMGQGDEVWEQFGHNAIWIHDEARGTDLAYNWGVFDFAQPHFLQRFLTGNTRYWVAEENAAEMGRVYVARNRTVWMQELDLTPAQRARLRDFIAWNVRPENRYYRYDYFRDNCSTRARDALDLALGGQLQRATTGRPAGRSYYWHSVRLTGRDVPVFTGMTLGLGRPAVRPISVWEEMFIPMEMQRHLRAIRVADEGGTLHPLVKSERVVFQARRPPELAEPPHYLRYFVAAGVLLGGIIVLLGRAAARGGRAALTSWVTVVEAWSILGGLIGVLMILAWTLTSHVYTRSNENFLQFEPLSLALAVLVPLGLRRPHHAGAARVAAWAICAIAAAGAIAKALPAFYQHNWDIIALALPTHLAVAWSVTSVTRRTAVVARAADVARVRQAA